MEISDMNNLELWNFSRTLASAARRVAKEEMSLDAALDEYPELPFTSEREIEALYSLVAEKEDEINDLVAKDIQARLKNPELSALALDYASLCIQILGDDLTLVEAKKEHPNLPFWSEEEIEEIALAGDADGVTVSLSREIQERLDQPCSLKDCVAETLAMIFIDRDAQNYKEAMDQISGLDSYPVRQVAMMEVLNSTGETRSQRVDSIIDWVETWYDNPDQAEEMNQKRPYPMGAGPY